MKAKVCGGASRFDLNSIHAARRLLTAFLSCALALTSCGDGRGYDDSSTPQSNAVAESLVVIESLGEVQRISPPQFPALAPQRGVPFVVADGPEWRSPGPAVVDVEFTPDAERLLVWLDTGLIKVLNATDLTDVGELMAPFSPFSHYAFSTDSKLLLLDAEDGTIGVWNLETREKLRTLAGHPNGVSCVAFSCDRRLAASGGVDGDIRLWNVETGTEIASQHAPDRGVPYHVWFNDRCSRVYWVRGAFLVGRSEISSFDGLEELLRANESVIGAFPFHRGSGGVLLTTRGGNGIYLGPNQDKARPTPHNVVSWKYRFPFQLKRLVMPLPGNQFIGGYRGDKCYEIRQAGGIQRLCGESEGDNSNVGPIAVARSGRLAASGYHDGRVKLFHLPPPEWTRFDDEDAFRQEVRELRKNHDFDRLDAIFQQVRDQPIDWETQISKVSVLFDVLSHAEAESDEGYTSQIELLESWRKANPTSICAAISLADILRRYAWHARGGGVAAAVGQANFEIFFSRLEVAQSILEDAAKLEPSHATLYGSWISVALGRNQSKEEIIQLYEKGVSLDPSCFSLHTHIVMALLPRWGGEIGDVASLADRTAKQIGGDDGEYFYGLMAQVYAQFEGGFQLEAHGFDMRRLLNATKIMRRRSFRSNGPQNIAFLAACFAGDQEEARLCAATFRGPVDTNFWNERAIDRYLQWARRPAPRHPPRKSILVGWQAPQSMALAHTDATLAIVGHSATQPVRFWDAETGESIPVDWPLSLTTVEFTPDDNYVIGAVVVGRNQPGTPTAIIKGNIGTKEVHLSHRVPASTTDVSISADGNKTLAGDNTGKLTIYPTENAPEMDLGERILALGLSPTGDRAIAIGAKGKGAVFNTQTGDKLASLDGLTPNIPPLGVFADGFATGGSMKIWLYDFDGNRRLELTSPPEPEFSIWYTAVAKSHDGKLLAAATYKWSGRDIARYEIELWDLDTKEILVTWDYHFGEVRKLAFTFDDRTVVSLADDGHACLWDAAAHRKN